MTTFPTANVLHALLLDGKGGCRSLSWNEVENWSPEQGLLWLHFDYSDPFAIRWLREKSGLNEIISDALLTEETRPRTTNIDDGLLMALRGVNQNPNSNPEDMVSIRLWADKDRIISTRKRHLITIDDLLLQFKNGKGPTNTGEFIVNLTDFLVWRMSATVDDLEDVLDQLEDHALTEQTAALRFELATLRRQTITLRRYLSPEKEAFARLLIEKVTWFDETHRIQMREVSDRLIRYIEDIDAIRERATVMHEELLSRTSDELNKRMYVLSIIAAIFLPLGFFTGLLGINIGGIPGANNPQAFWIFCGILTIMISLQIWLFIRKKWL